MFADLNGFTFTSDQLGFVVFATMIVVTVLVRLGAKQGQWIHVMMVQAVASSLVGYVASYVDHSVGGMTIERQLAGCLFSGIIAGLFMLLFVEESTESTVHTVKSTDTPPSPKSMWF